MQLLLCIAKRLGKAKERVTEINKTQMKSKKERKKFT